MIPTLLIWLFKKYLLPVIQNKKALKAAKRAAAVCLTMCFMPTAFAQDKNLHYNVLHKGNVVGYMQLDQKQQGDNMYLKMVSEVKMRFIFSVKVNVEESSHYQNGKLICSKVYRKVNGKEKANRQTKAAGDAYQTMAEGKTGAINKRMIDYNLMLLYIHEPLETTQIYSDNFQQFLKVCRTDAHTYRIDLPDGNFNYYTYSNGICNKVDIHHTLYTIQIALA